MGLFVVRVKRDVLAGILVLLLGLCWCCEATELMFELPDRDTQCFYEEIDKGVSSVLEYQVSQWRSLKYVYIKMA